MKKTHIVLVFGLISSLIVGPSFVSAESMSMDTIDKAIDVPVPFFAPIPDLTLTPKAELKSDSNVEKAEEVENVEKAGEAESLEAMSVFFREGVSEKDFDTVLETIGESRAWSVFPGQGFNAKLTSEEIATLRADKNVWTVEPVQVIKANMADVVQIVGATSVWQRQVEGNALRGSGQTVCLLDTGVDFSHESLTQANILGNNLDCYNGNCANPTSYGHMHGTHVAAIAAGSGSVQGIAPDAKIISLKVFPGDSITLDSMVPIYNAMNWCKGHAAEYDISVISMSFGSPTVVPATCDNVPAFSQVKQAIDQATSQNISVVASTGNEGDTAHIDFPACIDNTIAVSATNKNDTVWGGSNYNSLVKLFAPGSQIISAKAGGGTVKMSGTSMAAPVVSGSIMLINQYYDAIGHNGSQRNPATIEDLLKRTGFAFNDDINAARINIDKALGAIIPVSPVDSTSTRVNARMPATCESTEC